jgi:hypothetical protein
MRRPIVINVKHWDLHAIGIQNNQFRHIDPSATDPLFAEVQQSRLTILLAFLQKIDQR